MCVRVTLLLVLLLGVTAPAVAQVGTIRVTVVEDRTGLPVAQAQLAVQNDPVMPRDLGAGVFTLTVSPGSKTVVASAIGYAVAQLTVDVLADHVTPVTMRLSEGAGSYVEHIDVIGSLGTARADSPPGAVALYGRELQNLRGAILDDPLRAVQSLPAVSATDDFYSEFAVRGSAFRHIGVRVDGIPSKYLMHTVNDIVDGGSVTMINSETLGAVELLPGGYPQRTGRHIGAEVNLLTRAGDRERFHGRGGLSGTSASVLGEGPLPDGRGSWLASVRRSYLDYLIKRIDPSAGFAFGFVDAQAKLAYRLNERQSLDVSMLVGRATFDGDDYEDVNDTASAVSRSWLSSLGWRVANAGPLTIEHRAYVTGLDFDNQNPFQELLDSARFNNVGWRVDGSLVTFGTSLLQFGGDAQFMTGRHTRRAAPPASATLITAGDYAETASAASLYAQLMVGLGRITIMPGVRVDRWTLTDATTASPWVNIAVRPSERTLFRVATGIYRQFAEFDQVFGLNGGGTNLSPEHAVHLDAGVDQQLSNTVTLQATGFMRQESDVLWPPGSETRLVNNRIVPGAFNAKWINALNGDASGGEVVVRRDTPSGWSGWIGYSYSTLRYDRPAGGESFWSNADQRHTVALYGRYPLTGRTAFSGRYRYGSNFPIAGYLTTAPAAPIDPETNGPAFYQLTTERNTVRLPAYSRIDVRIEHSFLWGPRRLVIFVEAANLQNRKNLRNTPYSLDRNGRAFGVTETMMPIVPSAGMVLEF